MNTYLHREDQHKHCLMQASFISECGILFNVTPLFSSLYFSFISIVSVGLSDNSSISNSGMSNIKLYHQYVTIAQHVSVSRFE